MSTQPQGHSASPERGPWCGAGEGGSALRRLWAESPVMLGAPSTKRHFVSPPAPPPPADGARGAGPCCHLLSPGLFQSRVIPVLLQLFQVHEEHVRMVLLSHLEAYVGHFTQEQLRTVILPQVSRGGGSGARPAGQVGAGISRLQSGGLCLGAPRRPLSVRPTEYRGLDSRSSQSVPGVRSSPEQSAQFANSLGRGTSVLVECCEHR